jgi:hypothetical protein
MKYKPKRSEVKVRELPPKVSNTAKGVLVQCPFCDPTHVILPGVESPCGTTLRVTAVQTYLTSHTTKFNKIHCLKCGVVGGEMIKYRNGFVHISDCSPGTKLLTEIPPLSNVAKVIFKLPVKLRTFIEKRTGAVKELQEIDEEGKPTGKILGHFFWKG